MHQFTSLYIIVLVILPHLSHTHPSIPPKPPPPLIRHEPLCVQKVARRAKLTHLAFSPAKEPPLVLVGDDRGTCFLVVWLVWCA